MNNINIFPSPRPAANYSSVIAETDSIDDLKAQMQRANNTIAASNKNIIDCRNDKLKWENERAGCEWSGGISGIGGACGGAWKCGGKCKSTRRDYYSTNIDRAAKCIEMHTGLVRVNTQLVEEIQARITLLEATTSKEVFINKPVEEKIAESTAALDAKTKNVLTIAGVVVVSILCIGGAYVLFKKAKVA